MASMIVMTALVALCTLPFTHSCATAGPLFQSWVLVPDPQHPIPLFGGINLTLNSSCVDSRQHVCVKTVWGPASEDPIDKEFCFPLASTSKVPVTSRVFETNVFMGLEWLLGSNTTIAVSQESASSQLDFTETSVVLSSQGATPMVTIHRIYAQTDRLSYVRERSTRDSKLVLLFKPSPKPSPTVPAYTMQAAGAPPKTATFTAAKLPVMTQRLKHIQETLSQRLYRDVSANATRYVLYADNDWSISTGGLAWQTLMLSLQGLANRENPTLMIVYPPDWPFSYSPTLLSFYENQHGFSFQRLSNITEAVLALYSAAKGYVIWDETTPTTLSVAMTVAGLEDAVVVGSAQLPLMKRLGLPMISDLRGKFTGQSDAEIISWSYQEYFHRCNHSYVMWLGGSCGDTQHPAVADFGVMQRAFFAGDLSTKPTDTVEYELANHIVGSLDPFAVTVGWHSYCKDEEHFFTSLMSRHTARVHGLNTLPDLSFTFGVPLSAGFKFKNHHGPPPPKVEDKVYISCVQSDGLGLGAWNKPGRGSIAYTWEVTLNDLWMQPSMLELFYRQATPNDYFVGALSGPGYMYPKAVPSAALPHLISLAQSFMDVLDLNAFAMMDESQGTTAQGNMNLPKEVVEAYFTHMPKSIGFVNGYGPSFTFATNGSRPFLSYDYYLDPARAVGDAVADLTELATINKIRPYYAVREFSNITRVEKILAALGPEFDLVDTETLLQLSGQHPTFTTRFEHDPQ